MNIKDIQIKWRIKLKNNIKMLGKSVDTIVITSDTFDRVPSDR